MLPPGETDEENRWAKDVIDAEAIINRAKPLAHQQAAEIQRFQPSVHTVAESTRRVGSGQPERRVLGRPRGVVQNDLQNCSLASERGARTATNLSQQLTL